MKNKKVNKQEFNIEIPTIKYIDDEIALINKSGTDFAKQVDKMKKLFNNNFKEIKQRLSKLEKSK